MGGKVEWFRRTTWTPEDAAEFETRLKRSRSTRHRAQYLRIQAIHLEMVGGEELTTVALALLDRLVRDHPDPSELSMAHTQRGRCLRALGRTEEAMAAFEASLEALRAYPRSKHEGYLDYAELLLEENRPGTPDRCRQILDEFGGGEVWPASVFRHAVVRALVAEIEGVTDAADAWATRALEAADKVESPFRYHRSLGLVRDPDVELMAKLRQLAHS